MCEFDFINHDSNLSDHLPLHIVWKSAIFESTDEHIDKASVNRSEVCVDRFRWDHGDLLSYYNATRQLIHPVLNDINITDLSLFDSPEGVHEFVDSILIEQLMPYMNVQIFIFISIRKAITNVGGIKSLTY